MSFPLAHAQLVTIIKAISPTLMHRGRPPKFHHQPEANEEDLPDARGFWFGIDKMSMFGNVTPGFPRRFRYDMTLSVFYPEDINSQEILNAIGSDYASIIASLADPATWDRPTSTIVAIILGEAYIAPGTISDVGGGKMFNISFVMEFTGI